MHGRNPCIYAGFKEGVTRKEWERLFAVQDAEGMLGCLHRFEVRTGDTILIKGGIPHAIGAGCFLAEIQEPTDYTIRVEQKTPGGLLVDEKLCHQGLGFQRMFDCFHYDGRSFDEMKKICFLPPKLMREEAGGRFVQLVGYEQIPYFAMGELKVWDQMTVENDSFCGIYVLEGQGVLRTEGYEGILNAPSQYLIPHKIKRFTVCAENGKPLRIFQFQGPKPYKQAEC